jgi:hypothetical protein
MSGGPPLSTGRERISACLIVQNEERRLPAALASVAFCDEIVVVDGGSGDGTVAIARAAGAKVIESSWPGFATQRNVALAAAAGDWVLEIDADERVSPELRASIERLLADTSPQVNVTVCPLRNRFLGAPLGPSAKYPAYRTRLFRRGSYEHDETRQVHEGIEPRERPAVLTGDLEHELADTLGEALLDAWRYAKLESAHIAPPRGPRAYAFGIVVRPATKLLYRLILDGGWRDGWRGTLKVLLDSGSDALVWMLVLARALTDGPGPNAAAAQREKHHFGRRPAGQPKVVAIAGRGRPAEHARRWLGTLRAGGVDVALVSDEKQGGQDIPTASVARLWPLAVMHALDLEMQIRTVHAVVAFGRRASLVRRLLPATLRPHLAGVDAQADALRVLESLRETIIDG